MKILNYEKFILNILYIMKILAFQSDDINNKKYNINPSSNENNFGCNNNKESKKR